MRSGILGNFMPRDYGYGRNPAQFGILGPGMGGGDPSKLSTGDTVSLIASALSDGLSAYRGQQGQSVDAAMAGMQQQRLMHDLSAGMASDDPNVRARAYDMADMLGINTQRPQSRRAAADLPKLIDSMRSTPKLDATSARLPKFKIPTVGGGEMEAGGMDVTTPGAEGRDGLSLRDALAEVNSPELSQQMAPELMDSLLEKPDGAPRAGLNPATGKYQPYQIVNGKVRWIEGVGAEAPEAETRELKVGDQIYTQERQPDGTWKTIAKSARWQPSTKPGQPSGGVPGLGAGWTIAR